ncbi:DnaB-like helicase C-terminal domain-containing protein [Lysinibacillus xylanilyticus]|uniref:DnaB-like helicase C-terminal domain-containing protein n=1 Tax=Lysinibacillus xylanilyticus TaxID=582475 RepID=UPI00381F72FE
MKSKDLQDKYSNLSVFSKLLKDTSEVLSMSSGYKLTPDDFPEEFHRIIFTAINNLFRDGVTKITNVEINGYLQDFYPNRLRIFQDNGGNEYIDRVLELDESDNFDYHYNRVKKFSLLRHYMSVGIDITDIYDVNVMEVKDAEEQSERFNNLTVSDIVKHVDSKIIDIKENFLVEKDGIGGQMGEGIEEIFEAKTKALSYGANFISGFLNTVSRGARLRKYYCISGNSGSGKTRSLLAHVLNMCVPEIYIDGEWVTTNNKGRGLFISTELEEEEIKIPAICFIADVEEDKVQNNTLSEEEKARLKHAFQVLKDTPMWFEELFDFDDDDIEREIEKHVNKNGVQYIGFDYMHSTLKMFDSLAKQGARNLQEHQVLRIMSIRLKNICNRYNVWIGTSTQLNDAWKQGILDQSALEGSKSIVNKLDLGAIQIPLTPMDEKLYDEIKQQANLGFHLPPTHTINVYKNRGNKWKLIRIWVHFNLGTLRMTDLFVTNYRGELISGIQPTMVEYFLDEEVELDEEGAESEKLAEQSAREILDIIEDSNNQLDDDSKYFGD